MGRRPHKTVLLAWELGSGLGHVGPLLRVARELRRRGVRPVFALRDVVGAQPLLEGEDIPALQAPVWPRAGVVRGRPFWSANYPDLLANVGFSDAAGLAAMVRSWDALLKLVRPDLIVADSAPTACLAAYGAVPVALCGNGYNVPPAYAATFPPLDADRPPLMPEARLLENIHEVQRRRGRRAPPALPALFDAPVRAVATLPELDPYRRTRREPLTGPIETLPGPSPLPEDGRVFAYLSEEHPGLATLVECLAESPSPVEAYLRGDAGSFRRLLASRGARVHESPPPLTEVVPRAAVVVSHAGCATAHAALAGGRAQVLLPVHTESGLTARALESLGVGLRLPLDAGKADFERALARARRGGDASLGARALALAETVSRRPALDGLAKTADACLGLLS